MTAPPPLSGSPQGMFIEGILDGRILNEAALHEAVDRLGRCGAGAFQLEITGGRFNVMPSDTFVQPDRFDTVGQEEFLDGLNAVCEAARPGSIETNLRCKMIFADEVEEVLFLARGPMIETVTRRRPRTPDDVLPLPPDAAGSAFGVRRRELLYVAPVLLVLGLFLAWQTGWVDRVLAARAEQIQTHTGPFGDMVAVRLSRSWGNYDVELTRGAGFPEDTSALAARREGTTSLTDRAAIELVGNGGELFVALVGEDGRLLAESRVALRPLLGDAKGRVRVKLPGQMAAHRVQLSLSSGAANR